MCVYVKVISLKHLVTSTEGFFFFFLKDQIQELE